MRVNVSFEATKSWFQWYFPTLIHFVPDQSTVLFQSSVQPRHGFHLLAVLHPCKLGVQSIITFTRQFYSLARRNKLRPQAAKASRCILFHRDHIWDRCSSNFTLKTLKTAWQTWTRICMLMMCVLTHTPYVWRSWLSWIVTFFFSKFIILHVLQLLVEMVLATMSRKCLWHKRNCYKQKYCIEDSCMVKGSQKSRVPRLHLSQSHAMMASTSW